MSQQHTAMRGVVASLAGSVLFGGIFYLAGVVASSAEVVFAWRVLVTFACYLLALAHPAVRRAALIFWRRLRARWWMPLLFLALAANIGLQLWLFMWAPRHGHALDAALGYLLLPICLVFGGRFLMRSYVSWVQWAVVALAAVAVTVKIVASPQISWVTFAICVPYTAYFVLRRRFGLDGPIVFGAEIAALVPVAVLCLVTAVPVPITVGEVLAVGAIAIASAVAMTLFISASSLLSLPVFGLLGYVEPVLLVIVSFLLGESMSPPDVVAYGILALALAVLSVEGFRVARRRMPRADVGARG